MNKYKEINLEEGMPMVDEAMSYLKMSITLCKQNKIGCLSVVTAMAVAEEAVQFVQKPVNS